MIRFGMKTQSNVTELIVKFKITELYAFQIKPNCFEHNFEHNRIVS